MIRWIAPMLGLAVMTAGAQSQDGRLEARLDPPTYASVKTIIDSAKRAGLPVKPIEDKALESSSAGAAGPAIVTAVRAYTTKLGAASQALGKKSSADELRAGAGAIAAGIPARDLS